MKRLTDCSYITREIWKHERELETAIDGYRGVAEHVEVKSCGDGDANKG